MVQTIIDEPTPAAPEDIALVERLWRSGSSATAVSPSTRDDLGLLQRFLTADDRAVVVPLLRHHLVATWRLAAVITMDAETAATAVRTAWTEALEGRSAPVSTRANARAWLFAIVRRHALALGAAPSFELHLDADTTRVPFDQTGDVGLLAASFALLDEVGRTATWLHAVEGFDDADAAHVLGLERLETHDLIDAVMTDLRAGAVRGQLAAAPERCRPALGHFAGYLDDELSAQDELDLLEHLHRCRRCTARLDAIETPGLGLVDRVLDPPKALADILRDRVGLVAAT